MPLRVLRPTRASSRTRAGGEARRPNHPLGPLPASFTRRLTAGRLHFPHVVLLSKIVAQLTACQGRDLHKQSPCSRVPNRRRNPRRGAFKRIIRHSVSEWLQTRRLFVIIFALGLFVMACRNVTDPDVWWHLRTGQIILQTRDVPHADPYSYTRRGVPWIDHEWLSQVLIYLLFRSGGWMALTVTFGAVVAAALLLVFARSPGKPYLAAVGTLLGAFASAPSWGTRPQMITFLLASVALLLLERSCNQPRRLWWIPLLVLLWANLHAGYALGIGLLLLFVLGDALDTAFGFSSSGELVRRLKTSLPVLGFSLAVVVINPYGTKLYAYPLQTLHSRSMLTYISEWVSPDFHEARYVPLALMILGTLVLPMFSPRRLRPRELVLLLAATYAALRSVRHIPLYVLVAAPILSTLLDSWIAHFRRQLPAEKPLTRPRIAGHVLLLAAFAVFVAARLAFIASRQPQAEARQFPVGAVSYLRAQHPSGAMLNHYDWGGYFIWQLPQYPVYIDGRADVYGDALEDERSALYWILRKDWREVLERRGIRLVVLPPDAPLVTALQLVAGWRQVYADAQAAILTRQP